jgi:hypothetical protein
MLPDAPINSTLTIQKMNVEDKDWKLKLKFGKLKTEFKHYTALAEGEVHKLKDGFVCPPGQAIMAMKTWAIDENQSIDMIKVIGEQIGFVVTGRTYIYDTDPESPPKQNPYGYDINFTPFNEK